MLTLSTTVWENGKTITLRRVRPGLDGAASSDHQVEVRIGTAEARVYACDNRDACYAASREVCEAVYGRDHRRGGINATNSTVWTVTNLVEQVAGC
ncbi:MAG: hypothetical protein WD749_15330 [Phycisphaerales bacterium]